MDVAELLLSRHLSSFGKIGQRKILSLDQHSGSLNASRTPSRARAEDESLVDRRVFTSTQWRIARNFGNNGARRAIVIDQTSQQKETLRRIRDLQVVIKTLQSEIADKDDKIAALKSLHRERTKRRSPRRRAHGMESPRKRGRRRKDEVDPCSESTPGGFLTGEFHDGYDQGDYYPAYPQWQSYQDYDGDSQWQFYQGSPQGQFDQGEFQVEGVNQEHASSGEGHSGLPIGPEVASQGSPEDASQSGPQDSQVAQAQSPQAQAGSPGGSQGAPQDMQHQAEIPISPKDAPTSAPSGKPHGALPGQAGFYGIHKGAAKGAPYVMPQGAAHSQAGFKGGSQGAGKGAYGKGKVFRGWRTEDDSQIASTKGKGYRSVSRDSDIVDEDESEQSEESKESDETEEKNADGKSKTRTDSDRLKRFYADDHSKTALDRTTDSLIRMYLRDGSLQKKVLRQELLTFTEKVILRWGIKKNFVSCGTCPKTEARLADVEMRFVNMQKDSLKEISMLRKNMRLVESQMEVLKKTKGKRSTDDVALLEAEMKAKELEMKIGSGNELYEPIMAFEKEQREIMLEVINEKVRSILSMDAEAFGAKLPFGMKALPAEEAMAKVGMLEEELEKTNAELEKMKKKNWGLMDERDKLKSNNERLTTEVAILGKRGAWAESSTMDVMKEEHEEELRSLIETHEEESEAMVERYEELISQLKRDIATAKRRKSMVEELVPQKEEIAVQETCIVQQFEAPAMSSEAKEQIAKLTKDLVSARRELAECKVTLDHATSSAQEQAKAQAQEQAKAQAQHVPEVRAVTVADNTKVALLEERITKMNTQRTTALKTISELADVVGTVLSELGMNPREEAVVFAAPTAGAPGGVTTVDEDRGWEVFSHILKQDVARLHGAKSKIVDMAKVETARIEIAKAETTRSRRSGDAVLDQIVQEKEKLIGVIGQQKEELERLQLVVDELRRRITQMSEAAVDAGIPAEQMQEIMESSGLMGIADVKDKKFAMKVFQRLYDDAMDRLRRYSLMQAKVFAAHMGQTSPQLENQHQDRKCRGIEDYCDSVLQKCPVASVYKTLPPDYFMYGWIPEHVEHKPFTQYMKLEEIRNQQTQQASENNKYGVKLPAADSHGRRPLPAENRLLWRPRAQPRPCHKRPVDWHAQRTWTSFSTADLQFASDIVKRNKNHRSLKIF